MSATRRHARVDAYTEGLEAFAKPIFTHLCALAHRACPDAVKWSISHFEYRGENMCIFAAYKRHCSFGFWKYAK